MFPVAATGLSRCTDEDCVLGGYHIPAGTEIQVGLYTYSTAFRMCSLMGSQVARCTLHRAFVQLLHETQIDKCYTILSLAICAGTNIYHTHADVQGARELPTRALD